MSLQWGHGSEAVETNTMPDNKKSLYELQWGHGSEAVETNRKAYRSHDPLFASMGPRL